MQITQLLDSLPIVSSLTKQSDGTYISPYDFPIFIGAEFQFALNNHTTLITIVRSASATVILNVTNLRRSNAIGWYQIGPFLIDPNNTQIRIQVSGPVYNVDQTITVKFTQDEPISEDDVMGDETFPADYTQYYDQAKSLLQNYCPCLFEYDRLSPEQFELLAPMIKQQMYYLYNNEDVLNQLQQLRQFSIGDYAESYSYPTMSNGQQQMIPSGVLSMIDANFPCCSTWLYKQHCTPCGGEPESGVH